MKPITFIALSIVSVPAFSQTCPPILNNSNFTLRATANMQGFPGNFCSIWNYGGGSYVDPIGGQCRGETDFLPGEIFSECQGGGNPRAFTFTPQVGHSAYYSVLFPGECQPIRVFADRYTRIEENARVECTSATGDLYCTIDY
ncbi:hypothetical protein W97_03622 [Coniosporium apollinis CBS 100218]|uniref:AA1-like domain-containing protein n=1 Tax=Coniosporium apollinis (strain CBS 100218) TaxID=1168221 RepID=R7YRU3_CONA1|nr:uncharacterized protein W97_03622 [Coniosporium apollinis CBS 100218]EON64391.1 hypothetical protein W97_03622 [Coniosporium apollinis CBS 100218]